MAWNAFGLLTHLGRLSVNSRSPEPKPSNKTNSNNKTNKKKKDTQNKQQKVLSKYHWRAAGSWVGFLKRTLSSKIGPWKLQIQEATNYWKLWGSAKKDRRPIFLKEHSRVLVKIWAKKPKPLFQISFLGRGGGLLFLTTKSSNSLKAPQLIVFLKS